MTDRKAPYWERASSIIKDVSASIGPSPSALPHSQSGSKRPVELCLPPSSGSVHSLHLWEALHEVPQGSLLFSGMPRSGGVCAHGCSWRNACWMPQIQKLPSPGERKMGGRFPFSSVDNIAWLLLKTLGGQKGIPGHSVSQVRGGVSSKRLAGSLVFEGGGPA